jgi:hypothetical protein
MMMQKMWKWYASFKEENCRFKKLFLDVFAGHEKIKGLFCDFNLI